nr:hypothetical protein [Tanacetum cinerariifolium]
LKEARARDKELFEEAKEENRKQYEEKLKSYALTMKEEMVKEANAKIAEMFAKYTQLPIPPPCKEYVVFDSSSFAALLELPSSLSLTTS